MGMQNAEKKHGRALGYGVILSVYILATVIGIGIYRRLDLPWWQSLLIADVAATAVTFVFSVIFKNASVYDPYWSVQPIVILWALAVGQELTLMRVFLLAVVTLWGVRLTANWAYTFDNLYHQDWRYTMLKEKTGVFYPLINFLGIHLFPTLVVYACCLPVLYSFVVSAEINAGSIVFFAVSILAAALQGTADCQMHAFRKRGSGGFIRTGLWKYSRHPNYLGEIVFWWGIALAFVCSEPSLWYLAAGALINTLMFLLVSVPMADKRQSRKEGFAEYKRQTRMLFPIKK
jgi:steroid 5-alpha reductase family enzyme